jgi:hypothetical protein
MFVLVKNVPVNYAMRFSGPVTALTARRVRYGVGPDLICQPGPSPGIKTHSSPAAFPSTLSLPFSPWTLYLPARALGRCRAPLAPCRPPGPHRTDTTRPVEKMSQCHGCVVSSTFRPVHRPLTTTPMKRPALQQVAADLITRRP